MPTRLALAVIGDEIGPSVTEMLSFCEENDVRRLDMRTVDSRNLLGMTLDEVDAIGLALQMDVPRVDRPVRRFDALVPLAHDIGRALRAAVVDDYREPLSDAGIAMIRAQVAAIEKRMLSHAIPPGSAKARRLFS